MYIESHIVINCSAAPIFAYVTDVRQLPTWNGLIVTAQPRAPELCAVGARYWTLSKVLVLGHHTEVVWEVVACEPQRSLTVKSISGLIPTVIQYTFAPVAAGTAMGAVVDAQIGMLPVAAQLVSTTAQRQLAHDLGMLKYLVEQQPTPSAAVTHP